jgi:hypothetical protein
MNLTKGGAAGVGIAARLRRPLADPVSLDFSCGLAGLGGVVLAGLWGLIGAGGYGKSPGVASVGRAFLRPVESFVLLGHRGRGVR